MPRLRGKQIADGVIKPDGSIAFTANQSMGDNRLVDVADPINPQDAVNKRYVDAVAVGLDVKESVRLATTAALPSCTAAGTGPGKTLTANANGALSVDGVAVVVGDRILVKNEANPVNNGFYEVTATGSGAAPFVLTRTTDFDEPEAISSSSSSSSGAAEVTPGAFTFVEEGTTNADTGWVLITDRPIVIDYTGLQFAQFSTSETIVAGNGLQRIGDTISILPDTTETSSPTIGTSANGVRAAVPIRTQKGLVANVTSSNGDKATNTTVAAAPAGDGDIAVFVNGLKLTISDDNTGEAYFGQGDTTTARARSAVVAGDTLRWNGSVAGYQLDAADRIDFVYENLNPAV